MFIPWSFIPSIMDTKHIDSDMSSILLSFLGITSMISRLLNGAILDRKGVSPLIVCSSSTGIAGLTLFMLPFCNTFEMFAVVGSIYGLFSGGCIVSQTITLVAIYGIESMVSALGMFFLTLLDRSMHKFRFLYFRHYQICIFQLS